MPRPRDRFSGVSPVVATILLVAITLLLALLVLFLFSLPNWYDTGIPAIFVIQEIDHHSDLAPYRFNYDSRITLAHTGSRSYNNSQLRAVFYRNQIPMNAAITTMNGHDFISTHHYGIQWMGGAGCSGGTWIPGEITTIDFADGTFLPGDQVQVDILDSMSNRIISRHRSKA